MSGFIRTLSLIASAWLFSGVTLNLLDGASAQPQSPPDLHVLVDPNQVDTGVDDIWPTLVLKRAGFWSPHPSDYNPMRRPNPVLRPTSKRDFEELPYHPLAKVVSLNQRYLRGSEDYPDALMESDARLKKHVWPANLLFRLGSSGAASSSNYPARKGQKYVPSEPNGLDKA